MWTWSDSYPTWGRKTSFNKLKSSDQANTSDEQIAADNVKISTLETSISRESARVAQLTEEIDTLERKIAASKSEFSRCDRDLREKVGEY